MTQTIKIAVSGATGQTAYALLFRLAAGDLFGPKARLDLRLLGRTASLSSLTGVLKELEDCAFESLQKVTVTDDPNIAFKDVNWALLMGASRPSPEMDRSQFLKQNGEIFAHQGRSLNEVAANDVRILVVGNPCNTNTLVASHHAPNIPRDRFYGMTRINQNRGIVQLALKAQVSPLHVKNMIIWGNHSPTHYPDFYHATIDGQPAPMVIQDEAWLKNEFITLVRTRLGVITKARGGVSASPAQAIIDSISSLMHDTPKDDTYSVAMRSEGQYGADEGLIFSFPCRTIQGKVTIIDHIEHNEFGKERLKITLDELRQEYKMAKDLKLI